MKKVTSSAHDICDAEGGRKGHELNLYTDYHGDVLCCFSILCVKYLSCMFRGVVFPQEKYIFQFECMDSRKSVLVKR